MAAPHSRDPAGILAFGPRFPLLSDAPGRDAPSGTRRGLEALIQACPLAVVAIGPEREVLLWSPAAERLFGWRAEEVVGRILPLVPPDQMAEHLEFFRRARTGEALVGVRVERMRRDGSRLHLSLSTAPMRDEEGALAGTVAIYEDVGERRRLEQRVRESEEHFRSLIEHSADVIHVVDGAGRIRYISPSVTRVLGYAPEEMVGRAGHEFVHPGDLPAVMEAMAHDMARPGTVREMELRLQHRDGGWRTFDVVAKVSQDPQGLPIAIVNSHDVSDRKEAAEALRRATERAQRTAERMRAVAGVAAGLLQVESVEALQGVLRDACARVLPVDAFTFALYDPAADTLRFLGAYDGETPVPGVVVPLAGTPSERVVRERGSLLTTRSDDPAAAGARLVGSGVRSESVIRSPVLEGAEVLGVVSVQSYTPAVYGPDEVEVLEALAALAATALVQLRGSEEQRAAQEALRAGEARYRALFDKTPAGVVHFGPDLRVTECNECFVEMALRTREELIGFDIASLPDQRPVAAFARALEGRAASYEGPYVTPRGAEWEVSIHVSPLHDAAGRCLGGVAVVQDVTERHRMEKRLRRKESLYRRLVENATDIIYRVDAEGRFTFVNSVAVRMTGYPQEELAGSHFLELVRPDFRETVEQFYRRQLRERTPATYLEFAARTRDGRDLWIGQNVQLVLSGDEVEGMQAVARDISDRKWAEAALDETLVREREARAATETARQRFMLLAYVSQLLDASFDLLDTRGAECMAEIASMLARTVAGSCSLHEIGADGSVSPLAGARTDAGTRRGIPAAPEHLGAELALARRVCGTGKAVLVEEVAEEPLVEAGCDAGQARAFLEAGLRSLMVVPLMARGHLLGALALGSFDLFSHYEREDLAFAQELAQRIALALDNARLYKEAECAARLRDEVLAIVSHDLRNPLNVISIGVGDLLHDRSPSRMSALDRKQLGGVARAAERMGHLIRDLLDVARLESGPLPVDPVPCTTSLLVQQALELHLPLARKTGVALDAGPADDLPPVLADPDRLLQVLSNLLGNALRFTSESGRITVGARAEEREVLFTVADTGPGIAPEDLPHVFDRFWQARQARRAGAGLGLAIVRGVVEAHGGRVWAESRVGEGSTFSFTLPRAD